MINKHIENYLDYFCGLPHSPDYAVLIKGAWGSGKTWFINKYKDKLKANNKKYLYVSLYGLGALSEIEDSFFQQLHPVLSSKGMAITGKILKGLLKTSLRIDLDGDNKADTTVSSQIPDLKLPDYLKDTSECILIFDDLERCNINIESLLGYINHFVEHQGLKVIIIANEDEILKKSSNENGAAYSRIKEKLIGKTFGLVPDVENAINDFISKVKDEKTKQFLEDNRPIISTLYTVSGYENLRNLKQSIWDFERIHCLLPDNAKAISELVQRVLGFLLVFSFEIRRGSMLPSDILKLSSFYYANFIGSKAGEKKDDPLQQLIEKYKELAVHDPLPTAIFWRTFFDKGFVDSEELSSSIAKSIYFQDEQTPAWVRLWHYYKLSDEDFEKILSEVIKDFEEVAYDDIGVVKHVSGIFLRLSSIGLYNKEKAEILEELKNYMDKLKAKQLLTFSETTHEIAIERDSYGGLGFSGNDLPEFKELCEIIENAVDSVKIDNMPDAGKELLKTMQSDFNKFSRMVRLSNSDDQIFYETPIFSYINPQDFVNAFLSLAPEYMRKTAFVLEKRYEISSIREKLVNEIDWLKEVRNLINTEATARTGKVSGYIMRAFVDSYLDKIVLKLEQTIDASKICN